MMKVAVVQLNVSEHKEENIEKALRMIDEAAEKGANVVLLPEYVDYMDEAHRIVEKAEPIPGPLSELFSQKAKEHGVYLNCGSIHEKIDDQYAYNTSLLFDPNGEIIGKYRKVHLYDAQFKDRFTSQESATIQPGNELVTVETEHGKFGMTICYDVRFPELYRSLALQGAQLIFAPAAFPHYTGSMYWEALLRARAVENQLYIVAAGQFGVSKMNTFYGNSLIIDPWGTVVAKAPQREGVTIQEIDLSLVDEVRQHIPTFSHRRPDVYQI